MSMANYLVHHDFGPKHARPPGRMVIPQGVDRIPGRDPAPRPNCGNSVVRLERTTMVG
jgi:hypothetical protein